jgi:hypothetical protein
MAGITGDAPVTHHEFDFSFYNFFKSEKCDVGVSDLLINTLYTSFSFQNKTGHN